MIGINQTVRGNILEEASPDMIDDSTVEAIIKAEIKNHAFWPVLVKEKKARRRQVNVGGTRGCSSPRMSSSVH